MKKNFRIHTAALGVLLSATLVSNCSLFSGAAKTDDDVLTLSVLTGALSLLRGNCIVVTKSTSSAGLHTYKAEGTTVPKGISGTGCNEATFLSGGITTDSAAAKTASDAFYQKIIDAASGLSCGPTVSTGGSDLTDAKAATTTTTIAAAATTSLNNNGYGCTLVDHNTSLSSTMYCSSETEATNFRNRRQYAVVSDIRYEFATTLEAGRIAATAGQTAAGWTDAAIARLRPMTTSELTVVNSDATTSPLFTLWLLALNTGFGAPGTDVTCMKAVEDKSAELKTIFRKLVIQTGAPAATFTNFGATLNGVTATGVTTTQAAEESEIVIPKLTCQYTLAQDSLLKTSTCAVIPPVGYY